jgi:hypothetical protein
MTVKNSPEQPMRDEVDTELQSGPERQPIPTSVSTKAKPSDRHFLLSIL